MTKPATYEITSIKDMASIPRERWAAFLADLTIVVNTLRATGEAFDLGPEDMLDGAFFWTDDDAPGCEVNLLGPDDELLVAIKGDADA